MKENTENLLNQKLVDEFEILNDEKEQINSNNIILDNSAAAGEVVQKSDF